MHSTKMHKHRTTEEEEEEEEERVLCPSLSTHQVNPGLNLRLVCAAPPHPGISVRTFINNDRCQLYLLCVSRSSVQIDPFS